MARPKKYRSQAGRLPSQAGKRQKLSPPLNAAPSLPAAVVEAAVASLAADAEHARVRELGIRQTARVEELMVQGATIGQIHRLLTTPSAAAPMSPPEFPNLELSQVRTIYDAIASGWAAEQRAKSTPAGRDALREASVRRLQELRRWAMAGEYDPKTKRWTRDPDPKTAFACEKQIARLEGTEAPKKLDVRVDLQSQAMAEIMIGMDEAMMAELMREAEAERELADRARQLLGPKVIDVVAESPSP